jgi:hypothetical protein
LRSFLAGHVVRSVNDPDVGWKKLANGRLLAEMEGRFDLLITADRNMFAQQNLTGRSVCILVVPTNRRRDVLALGERITAAADSMHIGDYVVLENSGLAHTRSFAGPK